MPRLGLLLIPILMLTPAGARSSADPKDAEPKPEEMLRAAVKELVKMQEEGGQWPYEGVYRVKNELPVGYRIGGTSIVATTLIHAAPDDRDAQVAVQKALSFVIKELDDPLMAPSTANAYDVRIWGHAYALEFLCTVRGAKLSGDHAKSIDQWIKKLVEILIEEEIKDGGWNYANRRAHAAFVTAPVTQCLLLAHGQGEKVPAEIFERAAKVLEESRVKDGGFMYSGSGQGREDADILPGSIARSAVSETTLVLLGGGSVERIESAVNAFSTHWEELEKRRKQKGTHVGKYQVAPYYFYYGHRYCAQAIQMLPEKSRAEQRDKLLKLILKTRDDDGTWNDRVFERSRNYGTAMVVLCLLADKSPLPPKWKK